MFVGNGFDIHKHSKGENLILGGIHVDGDGFEAHSDGDIVLHSLCDALLGSKAKKDLGYYFPSDETTPKGISLLIFSITQSLQYFFYRILHQLLFRR